MNRTTVTADEVIEGHFLPDLDNGYVVETGRASNEFTYGSYNAALPFGLVYILFHDADGNENYLLLQEDHPIVVDSL